MEERRVLALQVKSQRTWESPPTSLPFQIIGTPPQSPEKQSFPGMYLKGY